MHGRTVVVQLQRDAQNIIAFLFEKTGDNGRIHTARHGNDHTGILRLLVKIERVHGLVSDCAQRRRVKRSQAASLARSLILCCI